MHFIPQIAGRYIDRAACRIGERLYWSIPLVREDWWPLWCDQVREVPLWIFMIITAMAAVYSFEFNPSVILSTRRAALSDAAFLVVLGCVLGALVQSVAWVFVQRYVRGQKDESLEVHAKQIIDISNRLDILTRDTKVEIDTLRRDSRRELKESIDSVSDRVSSIHDSIHDLRNKIMDYFMENNR